jgi:hypothetical protein
MNSGHTKIVRHPHTDAKITLGQFFAEFGGKHEKIWEGTERPAPLCHVCRGKLVTRGDERPVHTITVAHWPDQNWRCPLKHRVNDTYELLPNGAQDRERGRQLRALFMTQWWHHYNVISLHVGRAYDINDFIPRIIIADQTGLWNRAHLKLWELPYILMVWRAFEPVLNNKTSTYLRDHWIRFWLDPNCRSIDDLWIRASPEIRLIKTRYAMTKRKEFPGEHDLLGDAEEIEVGNWQPSATTNLAMHEFKLNTFKANFAEAALPM